MNYFLFIIIIAFVASSQSLSLRTEIPLLILHNAQISHINDVVSMLSTFPSISLSQRHEGAFQSLDHFAKVSGERTCMIGASTVRNVSQAKSLIDAGARFLSTTNFIPSIWEFCKVNNIPLTCGVQSEEELKLSLKEEVNLFKIYPVSSMDEKTIVNMLNLIRSKKQLSSKVIVAGGVKLSSLSKFAKLGVDGVAVGYDLSKQSVPFIAQDFQHFCDEWMRCRTQVLAV